MSSNFELQKTTLSIRIMTIAFSKRKFLSSRIYTAFSHQELKMVYYDCYDKEAVLVTLAQDQRKLNLLNGANKFLPHLSKSFTPQSNIKL